MPCAHEADAVEVIDTVLGYESGQVSWRSLLALAEDRDRRLSLVVDVSNLNVFLVDLLVLLDPCAKFVLTVREPRSWLDSILNHYLLRPPIDLWRIGRDLIHEYRNPDKRPVLDLIDATYLEAQIRLQCEPVMAQLATRMTGDDAAASGNPAQRPNQD